MKQAKKSRLPQIFQRRDRSDAAPAEPGPAPEATQAWLREHGRHIHGALGVETQWDPEEGRFKAEERLAIEHLEQVLSSHDAETAPDEPQFSDCSWETVFEQLFQATANCDAQRDISGASVAGLNLATQYIELIPEEYGLGVIKGALGLLFQSATQRLENKTKILDAFESVPETILTINTACAHLDASAQDRKLQRQFYSTLVKELPILIDLLLGKEKWYKKVTSFFDLRTQETLAIDDVLSRWNNYIRKLNEHITRMRDKQTAKTRHEASEAHRHASEANGKIDQLPQAIMQVLRQEMGGIAKQMWSQAPDTGAEAQTVMYSEMKLLMRYREQHIEHLECLRQEQERNINRLRVENSNLSYENEVLRVATPQPPSPGSEMSQVALISHLELLGIVGVPPYAAWEDLDIVLQEAGRFSGQMLGRVRWLLKTEEFLAWFQGRRSSMLLVEGHLPDSTQKITPLSVFGSTFVSSILSSPTSMALFFFGGLHCGEVPGDSGPKGLMRSLITQLLTSEKMAGATLDFLNEDFLAYCEDHDTAALCELFEQLVLQVPPFTQVLCVLDGLVWYEGGAWRSDLGIVIGMLENLTARMDDNDERLFKVMATFAGQSLEVSDNMERNPDIWKHATLLGGHCDPRYIAPSAEIEGL